MEKDEDRKLQIKIAQLNANLQVYLAMCVSFLAVFIALAVALISNQIPNLIERFGALIAILITYCGAIHFLFKMNECKNEFEKLQ